MSLPMWFEADRVPDRRCRDIDDQVEMRRKSKRLAECALPDGFRLVTPTPRQVKFDQQLHWAFVLAWSPYGRDLYFYAQRYEETVTDECQMDWALEDFRGELVAAGISLTVSKRPYVLMKKAS